MVQFNVPNCFSNDCDCEGTPPPSPGIACVPSECSGPKCCCCSSIDIVLGIRARCYDRVFFSCNIDGTASGPNPDKSGNEVEPFPPECTQCFDACDRALGGDVACASISQHVGGEDWQPSPPDWYNFPPDIGPCDCNCEDFVDPNDPDAGCNLTCVTCSGLRCNADVDVIAGNCSYQFNLTPGTGCCGTPALTDVVFAIDYSSSMSGIIASVKASVRAFADALALTGAQARFGLLAYGRDQSCLIKTTDIIVFNEGILTTDVDAFKSSLDITVEGGDEPDFAAAGVALQEYPWEGVENILFVIGDELIDNDCGPPTGDMTDTRNPNIQPSAAALSDFANTLGVRVFTVQPFVDGIGADTRKTDFSTNTSGGQDLDIAVDFGSLLDELELNVFGASCDCLDSTPVPIDWCRGGTGPGGDECIDPDVNIPIGICVEEDNSDCDICNEPMAFNVCGEIIIVEPDPDTVNLVCCGDIIGGGCSCPDEEFPPAGCCGVACSGIDICEEFESLQAAIDSVWCECWQKGRDGEFIIETPECIRCTVPDPNDPDYDSFNIDAIENCIIKVPDGLGGYTSISRSQVAAEVEAVWANCGEEEPPPSISASCLPECDRQDECIVGSPICGDQEDIRDCRKTACSDAHLGCASVRNPDTVILNNGIGLVAYESIEVVSVIKIEQFNTSVPAKILPNRRTNYGRLQHDIRWVAGDGDFKLGKLYYYEALPTHFINGLSGPPPEGSVTDSIVFQNGPLENQCFPLDIEPVGQDDVGNFVRFTIPNSTILSNGYPSLDDVYNIEWFIIDSDDTGLTGSVSGAQVPGSEFLLDTNAINVALELSPHIHNGQPVPVAYPSISTAHNYMNAIENSHYVYLVYQALENQKWNLYMRQLRLSEYSREEAITSGDMATLQELNIIDLVYRVVCVADECEVFGTNFLAKRTATFEVVLQDGRDVFNQSLLNSTEGWAVCPGEPAGSFLKKKVIVDFTHSAVTNRCPDQFEFNEIFYNWETGDEFPIPFIELTSTDLFALLKKSNDGSISLGEDTIKVSGITITSSQATATWYEDPTLSIWVTPNTETLQNILQYKGLDVSEPIPITEFEEGHCTHPTVAVNANNEVFVVYECTDPQVHQIHITGTAVPTSSFPLGVFNPKNLDANLDYFLSPADFKYRNPVTLPGEGINQLPDIHIDVNDIIHISWQSNRDNYWEIYYGNSEEQFKPKRITDSKSKSLKPSITGDMPGNLHIAWHDNRFNNWEIMMAYRADERDLTLLEQDPYLAGIRNTGYSYSADVIPLFLYHDSNTALCFSRLFVRFFTDRLLTQAAFDVQQAAFPMAFQIPGMGENRATLALVYADLTSWEPGVSKTIQVTDGTMFGANDVTQDKQGRLSDGIDTILAGSFYDTINITFSTQPLYVRFTAGETPDMALELQDLKQEAIANGENPDLITTLNTSWQATPWLDASFLVSGTSEKIDDMILKNNTNISEEGDPVISATPRGRYKRMFIMLPEGIDFTDTIASVDIVSVVKDRICIAPGETLTGSLDVTPFIRVDKQGNETVETPVPVGINKNQAYFISIIGIQDNGQTFAFDDQRRIVSCETCVNDTSPWNSSSCTYPVSFVNNFPEQETKFVNARVRFYTDQTLLNLVAQFDAFNDGDLECFTTDQNQPAQNVWTENGLEIFFGKTKTLTLWPMLSNTSGLLCGVTYWVTTETCVGNAEEPCNRLLLEQTKLESWICNCGSPRWEERFGDAPVNIRDVVRWVSSGDGFSDTRLTETGISVNNYNPVIRLRTDLTGIVVYESNRDDLDRLTSENEKHTIYGSAFSVFPHSNMYATGAEAINTAFSEVLIRSDIPISSCDGSDCDDSGAAMEGRNVNFVFDQYDNMFLAAENFADQTNCVEFQENSQRSIIVHRCGIQPNNLVFTPEESEGAGVFPCDASEILGKTAPLSQDKTFKKLIKLVRVNNKSAKYHITRLKKPSAVVDQCNIELDIITEPETVAIRLKNEDEAWSTWFPFDPDLGENTIRMPWSLSAGSGVKTVTIAAATYQGLSASFSLSVVADYKGIDHTIKFYKLTDRFAPTPNPSGTSYGELLLFLEANDDVFTTENLLQNLKGIPVAGIRQPTIVDDKLIQKTGEFIFVEIIPTQEYLESIGILEDIDADSKQKLLPTFDVLQQGAQDLFSVPTIFDDVNNMFKGVFPVQKEDAAFYKDGLSFVIPHFQQNCADLSTSLLSTGEYTRDQFNLVIPGGRTSSDISADVWANERDETGKIKHQIDVRGSEDPYFVFGDPNYRLKKQDE